MTLRTLFAATTLALTLGTATFAADLTADEKSGLQNRITTFETAFRGGDMATVMGVVPPKILTEMAGDFGMTAEQLVVAMTEATEQAMASVAIVSYEMALNKANVDQTSEGRTYALIPTQTVMKTGGQTLQSNTQTLGFADEDGWHLVRIDDAAQVNMLTRAYPDFAGIDFPTGTMKVIEE